MAVAAADRKDEVKLSPAIARLSEDAPGVTIEHNAQTHDTVLWGQGEVHLGGGGKIERRFGLNVQIEGAGGGYHETIRKSVTAQRGRHKRRPADMASSATW